MSTSQPAVDSSELDTLCRRLESLAESVDRDRVWPAGSLEACAQAKLFSWFVPRELGGVGWSELQLLAGYLALAQCCLTTTFILTQWHAACRRILSSRNAALRQRLAPRLAAGEILATVGISHLTTSRQHLVDPVLRATPDSGGYRLDGFAPWVTAASAADLLVLGATLTDGRQVLVTVDPDAAGVIRHPGLPLLALSASCTDRVDLNDVFVSEDQVVAGPAPNVMQLASGSGGGAGGLHTSILAVGLALRAVAYLREQSRQRPSLSVPAEKFGVDVARLRSLLEDLTGGGQAVTQSQLRRQANSLVLRTTQAALQAAKGAGFVEGHPAGRWAREALFFLVWSCPQPVAEANLCELAGLESLL